MTLNVTVFTTADSFAGQATVQALTASHIPHQVMNVRSSGLARRIIDRLDLTGMPVVVVTATGLPNDDTSIEDDFLAAIVQCWDGHRPDRIRSLAAELSLDALNLPTDPADDFACDSCQ